MKVKDKISPLEIVAILLLFVLAGINAAWLIISRHGGSFIAFILYLVVSFLCLRSRHFQAGVIAGIFGFGIHIYELFTKGMTELIRMDQIFFYINLIVPIPLTIASYLAFRKKPTKHK